MVDFDLAEPLVFQVAGEGQGLRCAHTCALYCTQERASWARTPLVICTASCIGSELLEKAARDGVDQTVVSCKVLQRQRSILGASNSSCVCGM